MNRVLAAFAAFIFVVVGLTGATQIAKHYPLHTDIKASPIVYAMIVDATGKEQGHGTAFNIGNGQFITAAHVAVGADNGNKIILKSNKGDELPADVVWMDKAHDVALLRLHDTSKASTFNAVAPFCKRPDVAVGDYVTSMGYPLNLGFVTSFGRVAKTNFKDADGTTVFLADLTVAPGNSGGPVLDSAGYVAGMAEAIVVIPLSMVSSTMIRLSFIVPRSVICADIASGGSVD